MGDRVSWRSRPRWDGTFRATSGGSLAGYSGPFSQAQIIELMWRVKSLRLSASMTYTGGTESFSHVLTCRNWESGLTITRESELMANVRIGAISFAFLDTSSGVGEGGVKVSVYSSVKIDGSNEYWLKGDSMVYGKNDDSADQVFSVFSGDNYELDVSTSLEFSDGGTADFVLCMLAPGGASGSCTMTIEEWWPYADLAGAPAWNTGTGLKANGGPGG